MHIKQLTISGFKSYREQTVIEPFSPGCNIVVGRNGSGKSNFFSAIRFVLNDAYSKLGAEERSALLHEGSGQPALSAYVEVVFDNADNRFPTGREEVVLRRTVGLKKDEYSLDHKIITKQDVMNLLQSAGFSRSNPYYIVPQGRITALCNAKDNERLALLKEVAGTRVYEEHRQESLKIMEETDRKREKITELLELIEERLQELEEERRDLQEYMELDRERRACEYVLWTRQQQATAVALGALEEERTAVDDGSRERELVEQQLQELQQIEQQYHEERLLLEESLREIQTFEAERDELLRQQAVLEVTAESAEDLKAEQKQKRLELKKLETEIGKREKELQRLEPELEKLDAQEHGLREEMGRAESARHAIQTKQGRTAQFKSASERDKWIRQEVSSLANTVDLSKRQLSTLAEERNTAAARARDLSDELAGARAREQERLGQREEMLKQQTALLKQREAILEARKEGWRAEAKLEGTLKMVSDEVSRWERATASAMDRATFLGLQSVQRIAQSLGIIAKVHGPLFSLFRTDAVFNKAVETVAGASLWHVVVDDDDTAAVLMEQLKREQSGRVTFIPLNRLSTTSNDDDDDDHGHPAEPMSTGSAFPLLERLQCSGSVQAAVRHVFGRALLVEELGTGADLARRAGMDAVTLQGDRASRRGAISGGYSDAKRSRFEAAVKLVEWREKEKACRGQLAVAKQKINEAEVNLAQASTQLHLLQRQQSATMADTVLSDLGRQCQGAQDLLSLKERTVKAVEQRIESLVQRKLALEQEIGTPLERALSDEERLRLAELQRTVDAIGGSIGALSKGRAELLASKASVRAELEGVLKRRRAELQDSIARLAISALHAPIELTRIEESVSTTADRLQELQRAVEGHADSVRRLEQAMDKARSILMDRSHVSDPGIERYLSKRSHLIEKREECLKRLRDVGLIDDALLQKYTEQPEGLLLEALHAVQGTIKGKYPHVNKRAREQYSNYSKQGEELRARREELEKSGGAIRDFIKSLDSKKDEAILRTFSQVSEYFSEVFRKLVPAGGQAVLEMVRGPAEPTPSTAGAETEEFEGVGVRVTFDPRERLEGSKGLLMQQLSGGQKSVVALALILAIQRVDPAPFYLFDEVDAALDSAHRQALAEMIRELAPRHQFIVTTFREELVRAGETCWGVSAAGERGSRVQRIDRELALQFVEHQDKE